MPDRAAKLLLLAQVLLVINPASSFIVVAPVAWYAGAAVIGSIGYGIGYMATYCVRQECCSYRYVPQNITFLDESLNEHLYGQHIAHKRVVGLLKGHVASGITPSAPLSLAFHGWTGVGKNYVANLIAGSFYERGPHSQFVHLYSSRADFPHESRIEAYKDRLLTEIPLAVKACSKSLFIFDEVDNMPTGLFDVLRPFLDYRYHTSIIGVDYRKTIFIFLNNIGGKEINTITLRNYEAGHSREKLTLSDFQKVLEKVSFFSKGGFARSSIVTDGLITAHVPFLPLEHIHVKDCIKDTFQTIRWPEGCDRRKAVGHITTQILNSNEIQFMGPYATRGCKHLDARVRENVQLFCG